MLGLIVGETDLPKFLIKTLLKKNKDFLILDLTKLNIYKKYKNKVLTKLQRQMLINYVDRTFVLNEELRKLKKSYVKRFKDFFCWKSFRYKKHLPVNGQRTQTNAGTCKKISV